MTHASADTLFVDKRGERIDLDAYEARERELASMYIKPHHRVLELGGRYGIVSCHINRLLADPRQHVVIEPDATVIAALYENRQRQGARFDIFFGAVSQVPVVLVDDGSDHEFAGWGNFTTPARSGQGLSVPITDVNTLQRDGGMQFNALFADCEGALETFFLDNNHFLLQLEVVVIERDAPERCNYQHVDYLLRAAGLDCVRNEGLHAAYLR